MTIFWNHAGAFAQIARRHVQQKLDLALADRRYQLRQTDVRLQTTRQIHGCKETRFAHQRLRTLRQLRMDAYVLQTNVHCIQAGKHVVIGEYSP